MPRFSGSPTHHPPGRVVDGAAFVFSRTDRTCENVVILTLASWTCTDAKPDRKTFRCGEDKHMPSTQKDAPEREKKNNSPE